MKSVDFLAKYGDADAREKISVNYGMHLRTMVNGPLPLTDVMKDNVIKHGFMHSLIANHPLNIPQIEECKKNCTAAAVFRNTTLPNHPNSAEVQVHLAKDPEMHSVMAIDIDHVHDDVKSALVDGIVAQKTKWAARQVIGRHLAPHLTDKIIDNFDDELVHKTAARYGRLSPEKFQYFKNSPEHNEAVKYNPNLTPEQENSLK